MILSAANLKEVAFGVGAGLTIAAGFLGPGATVVAALIYTLIACAGVITVVATYWMAADRVGGALDQARDWLVANNKVIVAAVLLVIGAILLGEGLRGLA